MNNDTSESLYIQLSTDNLIVAISVDDADLAKYPWHAKIMSGRPYACRNYGVRFYSGAMHRIIMERMLGRKLGKLERVDHADNNPLNNRRSNLRLATTSQNCANTKIYKNNTSGVKGVSYFKRENRWQATITYQRKFIHLGYYKTFEEAVEARQQAALKYFGEFARLE